jgi:bifunctional non-homologous end joining protein LigD
VRLLSRNLYTLTDTFRPVADALGEFPTSLVLDGEMVALNDKGVPDFEALQQWLHPRKRPSGRLAYMVFDCLYVHGHSLLTRTLEDRQAVLRGLRPALAADVVRITEALSGMDGRLAFRECARLGLEGVVAKRRASTYRPGARTRDWVKISVRHRDEFVVGGYLGSRPGGLGALIVGQYDRSGRLRYAGLVGTGLPEDTRRGILRDLEAMPRKTSPFVPAPTLRDHFGGVRPDVSPRWVKPTIVVEVEYRQRTADGLRHAALKGVRPDKKARDVVSS